MVWQWKFALFQSIAIFLSLCSTISLANQYNVIDKCWRSDKNWMANRQKLATCSIGFAGKMTNNIGKGIIMYQVTDPSDDASNPKKGTLRYGATMISGKVWITFKRSMVIRLQKPLFVSSLTTIDGRGANVEIAGNGCLVLDRVTDVIIHGLSIHDCTSQAPAAVVRPGRGPVMMGRRMDGDAIRVVNSSKVWIDHNTLYKGRDGLVDVSRGSTDVTISNNLLKDQDKVMLLGHSATSTEDKDMKVTIVLNHFGPNCIQRMPRIRWGYAHVANNFYEEWVDYAIGGSHDPIVISEANHFHAPNSLNKEAIWDEEGGQISNIYSVNDIRENGAKVDAIAKDQFKVAYTNKDQMFQVADAKSVAKLTSSAGALKL